MKVEKKATVKGKHHKFRVRRFVCEICGHIETIYADGQTDDVLIPCRAANDVKKMYKQQEENNL